MITARGIGATIGSVFFALLVCAVIAVAGPGAFASRTLVTVLLCPIVWGLAIFYMYWDEHPRRPLLVLTVSSAAMTAILLLAPEPV